MFATLLALVMLAAQSTTQPASGKPAISNADALAAIDRFIADPKMGPDAKIIDRFTQDSEDCLVDLHPNVLTWMKHTPRYEQSDLLNIAFMAGNTKAQLENKKIANDAYAGMLAVLKVYDKLRDANKDLKIPEVETYAEMEKKGELKKHIESVARGGDR